jgi:hypothetical protein
MNQDGGGWNATYFPKIRSILFKNVKGTLKFIVCIPKVPRDY